VIDFLTRVVLPIVTFLAGAFVQSLRTQHSETIAQINDLMKELEAAREVATEYWLKQETDPDAKLLAVKVRSAFHLIYAIAGQDLVADPEAELYPALDEFYSVATGGAFETAERPQDAETAFELRLAAAQALTILRARRRQVSSWTYMFVAMNEGLSRWRKQNFSFYALGRVARRTLKKLAGAPGPRNSA
jgi:hypothetical protein